MLCFPEKLNTRMGTCYIFRNFLTRYRNALHFHELFNGCGFYAICTILILVFAKFDKHTCEPSINIIIFLPHFLLLQESKFNDFIKVSCCCLA